MKFNIFSKLSLQSEPLERQMSMLAISVKDTRFRPEPGFISAQNNRLHHSASHICRNNMKLLVGTFAALLGTYTFAADGTKVSEQAYQLPQCAAPVASLVVGKLVCKAASCTPVSPDSTGLGALMRMAGGPEKTSFANFGEGMGAMLTTALKSTNCFDIQEREAMDELAKELALVGKKVEVQQADFMISGSITSLNMSTEKKQLGGGFIPIVGMFSMTTKTADLGMDIKVIDVNRAKILDSRTFTANNETTNTSFGAIGFGGIGVLAGGMSSYRDTPLEPIIRQVLAQVASFTATKLVNLKGVATPSSAPIATERADSSPSIAATTATN